MEKIILQIIVIGIVQKSSERDAWNVGETEEGDVITSVNGNKFADQVRAIHTL